MVHNLLYCNIIFGEVMNWKNAIKDETPLDKEEVHISINGIYNVAIYDISTKSFKVKNSKASYAAEDCPVPIYWARIEETKCG
jgi:hypothetical protein